MCSWHLFSFPSCSCLHKENKGKKEAISEKRETPLSPGIWRTKGEIQPEKMSRKRAPMSKVGDSARGCMWYRLLLLQVFS